MKAAIHLSGTVLLFFFFLISSLSLHAAVRINEVMSSNGTTIMDEDGEYNDWIELFNAGDQAVDLSGWGLSDTYSNRFKWIFPDETLIGPGEYMLIWASGKNRSGDQLHTSFSISAAGGNSKL